MSLSAVTGAFGFKLQTAKGVPATGAFYWHKVGRLSAEPVEMVNVFPVETGSGLLPGGVFKSGYWNAGAFEMAPRMDKNIGWLFVSFAGSARVTGSGPYRHVFPGMTDNTPPQKWLTFRRLVPKLDGNKMGETLEDCKVMSINMSADAASLLALQFQFEGLGASQTDPASGEGWSPTTDNGGYESYAGVPILACAGLTIDGAAVTNAISATIQMANNRPQAQQEMVIGSYVPHGITVLGRSIQVSMIVFWENADLYNKVHNNGTSTWSPIPYAPQNIFELWVDTPGNLTGLGYKGKIGFWTAKGAMAWQMRPLDLRPGNVVVTEMMGTVLDVPDTEDGTYPGDVWRLYLDNGYSGSYLTA
jgi:hypothetical protein